MDRSSPHMKSLRGSDRLAALPLIRPDLPRVRSCAAFTLMELMVVILVIAILVGLTIGTLGYVNRKGAESRAQAEVAALSAAIDSYKIEVGSYPAQADLFAELTGQGTVNTNKVYFEPTPSMGTNNRFIDPWGAPYNYNPAGQRNVGFFDLWAVPPKARDERDWIHN